MFSYRNMRKIKKILPLIVFLLCCLLLYQRLTRTSKTPSHTPVVAVSEYEPPQPQRLNIWLVVFTDKDQCIHLATIYKDWTILQVGNIQKPNLELRHDHCIYHDVRNFTAYNLPQNTPTAQVTEWKYLAFLHAIKNGAEAIYTLFLDQQNEIYHPEEILLETEVDGLLYGSTQHFFNPVHHWGCNVSELGDNSQRSDSSNASYTLCSHMVPAIQSPAHRLYSVQDQNDDDNNNGLIIDYAKTCDMSSPTVFLAQNTYAYVQLKDSFFLREAFWALDFVHIEESKEQVFLSYLVQKVLWWKGSHVMIYKGSSLRTSKYNLVDHFVKFLDAYSCKKQYFSQCLIDLMVASKQKGFVTKTTVDRWLFWLKALADIGYKHGVQHNWSTEMFCNPEAVDFFPVNHDTSYSIKKWKPTPFLPVNNVQRILNLYKQTCSQFLDDGSIKIDFYGPWIQWENILLIIVFNNPHYNVIPYTEVLYRSFFPNILYCGPETPSLTKFPMLKDIQFSFVSYDGTPAGHFPGSFNYKCISMAVQMRYNVAGYLVIADDVLLVPKMLQDRALDKVWFMPNKDIRTADMKSLKECRLGMCDYHTHWRWWEDYRLATFKAFEELKLKRNESYLVNKCHKTLVARNGGEYRANGAYADIIYIPKYYGEDFSTLSKTFLKHYVFLEIAVPTMILCLVPNDEILPLNGKQIWDESRDTSWLYFTKQDMLYKSYMHPAKWSYIDESDKYREFFCSASSYIHDPYGRLHQVEDV